MIVMITKESFEPVTETGWRMGFSVMMKKELKAWFGTKAWWQQALLWSAMLSMFGAAGIQDPEAGMMIFYMMATIFPSIATIIVAHENILEEKRSGSAAWILSKPVSREAFLLPKFLGLALGFSISMIFIPGIVVYLVFLGVGLAPSLSIYLLSLIPMALWQMFLAFLTICLGTFFSKPGPVMAAPFLFVFLGINLGQVELISPYGPWGLYRISLSLVDGSSYPITPALATLIVLAALIAVAIWRFKKHEF